MEIVIGVAAVVLLVALISDPEVFLRTAWTMIVAAAAVFLLLVLIMKLFEVAGAQG